MGGGVVVVWVEKLKWEKIQMERMIEAKLLKDEDETLQ